MSNSAKGLGPEEWAEKLRLIAKHLEHPASLCLIGSAPGMFAQQSRISIDLDVWQKGSNFFYSDLKQAVEKSGLLFNPKDEMEPDQPYIQIVEQGVVQVGPYKETETLMKETGLTVVRPPIENIIASKLVRASPKDLEDIAYLRQRFGVSNDQVKSVVEKFPFGVVREQALENLVFLEVLPQLSQTKSTPKPKKPSHDIDV